MSENKLALIGFGVLALCGYMGFVAVKWLTNALSEIRPELGVALIAASATIVSSVYIASFNARRAKEVAAYEAHRARKASSYDNFMKQVVQIMRNTKAGKSGQSILPKDIEDFFFEFNAEITVYGGPGAVKAYSNWRNASSKGEDHDQLQLINKLFQEMRKDLGESNKGIANNELIGLFIAGGKSTLES
ncbi:MAG: hypothetical protein AAF711_14555 [Planctomycetota bacterium]